MGRALLLAGILLLSWAQAACSLDSPKIVAVAPVREATDVPTNQEIRISFDRPMDRQSVEKRFALSPTLSDCAARPSCGLSWSANTLIFNHQEALFHFRTRYAVSLQAGYRDSSGQANGLEHSWSFTTEGPPVLAGIDPPDQAQQVDPAANLVLSFSRPMDAESVDAGARISPPVPFLFRSRPGGDGSQLELVPVSLLLPRTTYHLLIEGARDSHGNLLAASIDSRFTTGPASFARKIGYLMGTPNQADFGIAVVDPHPDAALGRATPKIVFELSDSERLTQAIRSFDWAPDGQRVVIELSPRASTEGPLQILNLATGGHTDLGVAGSHVSWSGDGSTIVYLTHGNLHSLQVSSLADLALTDEGSVQPDFAVSPDGKTVAYVAIDSLGASRLRLVNTDLRTHFAPIGLTDPADHPAWSIDGTRIAFRRNVSSGPELTVYDLNQSGAGAYRPVGSLDVASAVWLNDNSTLVAAVGPADRSSLYRINVFAPTEVGGATRLTGSREAPNGAQPSAPAYDRRVAFVGMVDGQPQIFVVNGDGSHPQQLTLSERDYPYTGTAPSWSPTG